MLELFSLNFDREALRERLSKLAAQGAFIGTSSWKYPGWLGMLYDRSAYEHRGRYSEKRFEDECLAEYGRFFRTVCVDAGYYKFPDGRYLQKLFGQVNEDFRFTFKVTDTITIKRFPRVPRFGPQQGQLNPHFLDAELFVESFLAPFEPFREQVGTLIFEFSEFRESDFPRAEDFILALDEFLGALPPGWRYGVEIRNEAFLGRDYFRTLRRHNVSHVYNQWTRMPSVEEQLRVSENGTADFAAARFLLTPGRAYEEAVQEFSPYTETKEVDPSARRAARTLIRDVAVRDGKPVFVYINNRLEGNALRTIWALTEQGS
ncbi:MAG: DUF72 domain-containing protein [Verrucomicrobia bacterium]|nr:DUF72 domain-containing protein [Verrucomicrobiota bacterium]